MIYFGPEDTTIRRMIGAAMVRRAADYLHHTSGCSTAVKLLETIEVSFAIVLF